MFGCSSAAIIVSITMLHECTKLFRPLKLGVERSVRKIADPNSVLCNVPAGEWPQHRTYARTSGHIVSNLHPNSFELCRWCHNYRLWEDDGAHTLWSDVITSYVQLVCDFANSRYGRSTPGTVPEYAYMQYGLWDAYKHSSPGRNPIWMSAALTVSRLKYLLVIHVTLPVAGVCLPVVVISCDVGCCSKCIFLSLSTHKS